jgi:hypothetical protein
MLFLFPVLVYFYPGPLPLRLPASLPPPSTEHAVERAGGVFEPYQQQHALIRRHRPVPHATPHRHVQVLAHIVDPPSPDLVAARLGQPAPWPCNCGDNSDVVIVVIIVIVVIVVIIVM